MHSLLNTVGFSKVLSLEEEEKLIEMALKKADNYEFMSMGDGRKSIEMTLNICDDTGIVVCGEQGDNGSVIVDHYFPMHHGSKISMEEKLNVNKRMDTDSYTIMCDDYRLGVTMIFYLQNKLEMLKSGFDPNSEKKYTINLSALAHDGKILLPVENANVPKEVEVTSDARRSLIEEVQNGNQEAIENLAVSEIDRFAIMTKRAEKEDIYSIIDTTFLPSGSESDNYSLIGYILDVRNEKNKYTNEELYILLVKCNDVIFDVCINKNDLLGEPAVGRRIKCTVWMQGYVNF